MKLSLLIPAYNEEKRIGKTLSLYLPFLTKKLQKEYELLVVLNGCKDNTLSAVKPFMKKYPQLRYKNIPQAIGKGGAIIEGFKLAKGDLIGYVDADASTSPDAFLDLYTHLDGNDAILASRWISGARVFPKQPFFRIFFSRVFNLLIRVLFFLPVHDSQCGAKLFTRNAITTILPSLGVTRWAFDVDLLYQLRIHRFKWEEFPTTWRDSPGSTLNLRRATVEMFFAVLRLRLLYSHFRFIVSLYDKLPNTIKLHHYLK